MIRFVGRDARVRLGRTLALAAGILVAAVSFILLTAATRTSRADINGTVESNYRAAYDILVRPRRAATKLERTEGLVRPNFLSGVFGGITLAQYHEIEKIPHVEVAAPSANLGYIFVDETARIPLDRYLNSDPVQLFRIRLTDVSQGGASRYPNAPQFVYFTRRNRLIYTGSEGFQEFVPGRDPLPTCGNFYKGVPRFGLFARNSFISCFSARSPGMASDNRLYQSANSHRYPPGKVGSATDISLPLFVAAIDPVQEAKLLGLDKAIVAGRYLRPDERPRIHVGKPVQGHRYGYRAAPALASTRTYVDSTLRAEIERLEIPPGADVPALLASRHAYRWVSSLSGRRIGVQSLTADSFYRKLLRGGRLAQSHVFTSATVDYRTGARLATLRPMPVRNPVSIWSSPFFYNGVFPAPTANADVQFRRLKSYSADNHYDSSSDPEIARAPSLEIVGRYDPEKIAGFSPLSRVPLETYYPPLLEPADEGSATALHGRPLLPSQNLGDYVQQPPLVLTTLEGLKPYLNPQNFHGVEGKARAPISAIRVRVAGVTGPDELSQARVRAVAQQIHERTGLTVDVTIGSSPKPLTVDLPRGKFGRPELLLREGWSKKGASVSYLRALDRKSVAVFSLILVICSVFLGNGALAAVRARRSEIGVLSTLGWSPRAIFAVVLGELVLVGLAAGIVGTLLAAALVEVFSLALPLMRTLLVLPLALALAAASGFLPAWKAARATPLDAVLPRISGRRAGRRVSRLAGLALVNLRRVPGRTLVGAAGLAVGVGALTVLLAIQRAFEGVVVGTLLGNVLSIQVQGADLAAVGLVILLAGFSVADVLYVNLRERAGEFAALRTLGWPERSLAAVVALEALALGLLAGLAGALVGLVVAWQLGVPLAPILLAAALAVAGGLVVSLLACLIPLARLAALTPVSALAEE